MSKEEHGYGVMIVGPEQLGPGALDLSVLSAREKARRSRRRPCSACSPAPWAVRNASQVDEHGGKSRKIDGNRWKSARLRLRAAPGGPLRRLRAWHRSCGSQAGCGRRAVRSSWPCGRPKRSRGGLLFIVFHRFSIVFQHFSAPTSLENGLSSLENVAGRGTRASTWVRSRYLELRSPFLEWQELWELDPGQLFWEAQLFSFRMA